MKKNYFKNINWDKLRKKEININDIPFKPNPNKY